MFIISRLFVFFVIVALLFISPNSHLSWVNKTYWGWLPLCSDTVKYALIAPFYVPTTTQIADIFPRHLLKMQFEFLIIKLGIFNHHAPIWGGSRHLDIFDVISISRILSYSFCIWLASSFIHLLERLAHYDSHSSKNSSFVRRNLIGELCFITI